MALSPKYLILSEFPQWLLLLGNTSDPYLSGFQRNKRIKRQTLLLASGNSLAM